MGAGPIVDGVNSRLRCPTQIGEYGVPEKPQFVSENLFQKVANAT